MTEAPKFRVFDTGPLSAFANADGLMMLRILCDGHVAVLLDEAPTNCAMAAIATRGSGVFWTRNGCNNAH